MAGSKFSCDVTTGIESKSVNQIRQTEGVTVSLPVVAADRFP